MALQPSHLFINSDHRTSGTADNFIMPLDTAVQKPKTIMLKKAVIPLTCYNIPQGESTFYWYVPGSLINGVQQWALKSFTMNTNRAFLNPSQLVAQFNSDASGNNISLAFDPDPSSATYSQYAPNTSSYRMTLTCNTTFMLPGWADTAQPNGNPINMYFNLNQRLGFSNQYLTPQITGSGTTNTFKAPSPPNLQRTSAIHIRCNVACDTLSSPLYGGGSYRDIVTCIPCTGVFGDVITYNEVNGTSYISTEMTPYIKNIGITLLDDQFNPLGLPDNAISTYEFQFTY